MLNYSKREKASVAIAFDVVKFAIVFHSSLYSPKKMIVCVRSVFRN